MVEFRRAARLPVLLLIFCCLGPVLVTVLAPSVLAGLSISLAGALVAGIFFLHKQLETFDKAADTAGLTAGEVRLVTKVLQQRHAQTKVIFFLGILSAGLIAVPFAESFFGVLLSREPLFGLACGAIVGISLNQVLVYFDWRADLARMQQIAKVRNAKRAEADKALAKISGESKVNLGTFDGFRRIG